MHGIAHIHVHVSIRHTLGVIHSAHIKFSDLATN